MSLTHSFLCNVKTAQNVANLHLGIFVINIPSTSAIQMWMVALLEKRKRTEKGERENDKSRRH